jgi:hypothetical protein
MEDEAVGDLADGDVVGFGQEAPPIATPDLIGHFDVATCSGAFVGWAGTRGKGWPSGAIIEIGYGRLAIGALPLDKSRPDLAAAGIDGAGFQVFAPARSEVGASEVVLSAVVGGQRQVLASADIVSRAGRIDWIDAEGRVRGWAVAEGEWPLAVEVLAGRRRVCTALADGYHVELAGGDPGLVGFVGWIPRFELRRIAAGDPVVLRCLRTGAELFAAPAARLMLGRSMTVRGRLPIDALVGHDFEKIYDASLVDSFYRKYGPDLFVEFAYCYILERGADLPGIEMFVSHLKSGETSPRDLLSAMFHSDERRAAGPFLGPAADSSDYPFADHRVGGGPAIADRPLAKPKFHPSIAALPPPADHLATSRPEADRGS